MVLLTRKRIERRKVRRRYQSLIVILVCLLTSALGQEPKPSPQPREPQDTEVVRVTTNLVQIDASVTDKSGRQITDLRPEDFEVTQDGRGQKITNVSYISTRPPSTNTEAPTAKPGGATTVPIPLASLRPDQVRRTIALVVDDLALSFTSTAFVRRTLTKYINEQIQPGDLVAIIRTSAGAGALQQFTNDKRQLLAAVDQVRWYPLGQGHASAFAPIEPNAIGAAANTLGGNPNAERAAAVARELSDKAESEREDLGQLREEAFAVGTLGAVNYVVRGLEKLPGRKSVVLLSDGFKLLTGIKQGFRLQSRDNSQPGDRDNPSSTPNTRILEALQKLTDAANRASVVIYTMDTRGLQTLSLTAEDNVNDISPDRIEGQLLDRRQEFVDTQAGLAYLARLTGGLAIQNENDLNKGLQRVLDDQAGYYLIGYRPDDSTFDPKTGRPNFHKIVVRVHRSGARVRSRSGFFGIPDAEARQQRAAGKQLDEMLASPFGVGDVHLRLTSLFGNDDRQGSIIASVLHIDGHDLTFKEQADGWREADIEVMAYTFGAYGQVIDSLSRTHKIRTRDVSFESALRDGLFYTVNVPIKKPGAYQLRIAVRDTDSQRVGTASQFVQVPDLSKERLALSGIFASGIDARKTNQPVDANSNLAGTDDAAAAQASPGLRRFHSGMEMYYAYYIYNAKLGAAKRPQLTTQMKLFHDGQLAYEGKVTPYDAGPEPDLKRLRSGGNITLSPKAAAGEYVLQVIVTDKLAKEKQNTATQWIDFEILK